MQRRQLCWCTAQVLSLQPLCVWMFSQFCICWEWSLAHGGEGMWCPGQHPVPFWNALWWDTGGFIFAPVNTHVLILELGLGWACPTAWDVRKDSACSCCSSGNCSRCCYLSRALYGYCSFLPTHSLELFSLLCPGSRSCPSGTVEAEENQRTELGKGWQQNRKNLFQLWCSLVLRLPLRILLREFESHNVPIMRSAI